ncbi:T9SS C-terminal target domain-containing protein [Paraflavitalea soli]|uniref:T9SS C-terminal target domain-containing protein n=1 Tax=Paraflavitalea soli TaxID=2315862 RepID=A0A3B7MWH9_9BACT|nr:T9SS type A sorting domain-containing protein [Paraflavitalea soli]AXY77813.1 T9SS C-terminal target domain-containing protein [Paraflavitalea soli]
MYPNCTHVLNALIVSYRACARRFNYLYGIGLVSAMLLSSVASAQCIPPSMTFKTPTLIGGTARQVGAIYKFANVATGVDATIQIMGLTGGAGLNDMDNTTQGYYDAWQPYVTAGGSGTSYLDWKITFKKAGTTIDTLLRCLAITAVDIDGDGSRLKEFIVASTPGAYAVDPNTNLTVSFDGVNSHATGNVSTVPNIDTSERKYMFQMNFTNVSTIYYRNGSISTKSATDVRHTCIYFKSFFDTDLITLPVRIVAFTAKTGTEGVNLEWTTADEKEVQQYTVLRSVDGVNWDNIGKVNVQQDVRNYAFLDKTKATGRVYYKLQQTSTSGSVGFSRIIGVNNHAGGALSVIIPTLVSKNIPVQLETPVAEVYHLAIYNSQGSIISQRSYTAQPGINFLQLQLPGQHAAGMYMVAVRNTQGVVIARSRVIVQ